MARMPFPVRPLLVALAVAPAWPVLANESQASPAVAQQPMQRGGEPAVERKVLEDDGVRIEELRVRGHTQRIVVRSKVGNARAYEIVPSGAGRDLSQDKGSSGQRVWHVLSF